jgi:V8-like Glu-specific endopeptidase
MFVKFIVVIVLFAIMSGVMAKQDDGTADSKVIYGTDNRKDLYQVTDTLYRSLADSTVVLMNKSKLTLNGNNYQISSMSFQTFDSLCADEPFKDQPVAGFCSGTLVRSDIIITAGHCINAKTCSNTRFAFGYDVDAAGVYPTSIPKSEVYSCKTVLKSTQKAGDYAIVQLDRAVTNHTPVTVSSRTSANPLANGSPLLMIGYPVGLPVKIDDGAAVCGMSNYYYNANTDSYGGNSGSGIFHRTTGELEGILVTGLDDFVYDSNGNCYRSSYVTDSTCGEGITKISLVTADPAYSNNATPTKSPTRKPTKRPKVIVENAEKSAKKNKKYAIKH